MSDVMDHVFDGVEDAEMHVAAAAGAAVSARESRALLCGDGDYGDVGGDDTLRFGWAHFS